MVKTLCQEDECSSSYVVITLSDFNIVSGTLTQEGLFSKNEKLELSKKSAFKQFIWSCFCSAKYVAFEV